LTHTSVHKLLNPPSTRRAGKSWIGQGVSEGARSGTATRFISASQTIAERLRPSILCAIEVVIFIDAALVQFSWPLPDPKQTKANSESGRYIKSRWSPRARDVQMKMQKKR
jgi:hypothetical protein